MARRKKLRSNHCPCNPLVLFLFGIASITTFVNVYFGIFNKEMMSKSGLYNKSINLDEKLGLCRLEDAPWPRVERSRGLHAHVWCELCHRTTADLCRYPLFPKAPSSRDTIDATKIRRRSKLFGQRIFGFIEPPTTGLYRFAISASDPSELWLSSDHHWQNATRIARVSDKKATTRPPKLAGKSTAVSNQISDKLNLEQGKQYFVDILNIQAEEPGHLEVQWQRPQNDSFEIIDSTFLAFFLNETGVRDHDWRFDHQIPECIACVEFRNEIWNKHFVVEQTPLYLDHAEVASALPPCAYSPSYVVQGRKMRQWQAVRSDKITVHTFMNPLPVFQAVKDPNAWHFEISKCQVESIVAKYIFKLEAKLPGKFKLHSIKHVERKRDLNGTRYLLELELQIIQNKKIVLLSEYIYSFKDEGCLCYPVGLQWNRTADIYFVVTSKNQGRWVQHLINNMARIYSETKDEHIHLVIFDYDSTDIDLEYSLNNTVFPRTTFVRRTGKFLKTRAYNDAVQTVRDPNAIIFLLDLHYEISSNLIFSVRKHVIQARMVYTPIIIRLDCGSLPNAPRGMWEDSGYGPIGLYRSDWAQIGGFVKHRQGWGGEDWDLIDQVAEKGLEYERLRTPHMYHYFHTHKGMWKV